MSNAHLVLIVCIFAACGDTGFRAGVAKVDEKKEQIKNGVPESLSSGNPTSTSVGKGGDSTPASSGKPGSDPGQKPSTPGGIVIQSDCANGKKAAPIIDFESTPENTNPANAFQTSHGVTFKPLGPGQLVVRRTTRQGDNQPPKEERAWFCIKCDGAPSFNRLMDAASEQRVKRHILTTTDATADKTNGMRVEYAKPVKSLSFDLIDLDGGESWSIRILNDKGEKLATKEFEAPMGYNKNTTLNGRYKTFSFSRAEGDIAALEFRGEKAGKLFGFAFDNFDTGVEQCK